MRVGDRQRITRPTAPGLIDSRLNFTRRFRIRAQNGSFLRPFALKLPLINFCRMLGWWSVQKLRLLPPKTQDPKSLAPHESLRTIPATSKWRMAAPCVYPAGATCARSHEPAADDAARCVNCEVASRIGPSSELRSSTYETAPNAPRRRPSAHDPKIRTIGTQHRSRRMRREERPKSRRGIEKRRLDCHIAATSAKDTACALSETRFALLEWRRKKNAAGKEPLIPESARFTQHLIKKSFLDSSKHPESRMHDQLRDFGPSFHK